MTEKREGERMGGVWKGDIKHLPKNVKKAYIHLHLLTILALTFQK